MTSRETKRKGKRRQIETNFVSPSSSTLANNNNNNTSCDNAEEMTVFDYLFVWVGNPHSFTFSPFKPNYKPLKLELLN